MGNDIIFGVKGNDTLNGDAGADTYVWAKGDGNDTIGETAYYETDTVVVTLKLTNLNPPDNVHSRDQGNLYVNITSSGEKITISGHFSSTSVYNYSLERILFADGRSWDKAKLDQVTSLASTIQESLGQVLPDIITGQD